MTKAPTSTPKADWLRQMREQKFAGAGPAEPTPTDPAEAKRILDTVATKTKKAVSRETVTSRAKKLATKPKKREPAAKTTAKTARAAADSNRTRRPR